MCDFYLTTGFTSHSTRTCSTGPELRYQMLSPVIKIWMDRFIFIIILSKILSFTKFKVCYNNLEFKFLETKKYMKSKSNIKINHIQEDWIRLWSIQKIIEIASNRLILHELVCCHVDNLANISEYPIAPLSHTPNIVIC
jgi:hypothetical protein